MKELAIATLFLFSTILLSAQSGFKASKVNGRAPMKVSFKSTNKRYTTCHWEFGNGKTATGTEATTTFEHPGVYVVKMVTSDGYRADSSFMSISVDYNPNLSSRTDRALKE